MLDFLICGYLMPLNDGCIFELKSFVESTFWIACSRLKIYHIWLIFVSIDDYLSKFPHTSRKTIFYDNFVLFWMHHPKHSCHFGHFLSFWIASQKIMFSTSDI